MGLAPSFRIEANSSDITATIRERFRSLSITDNAGIQSDSLTITLADNVPEQPIMIPNTGAELAVWIGYDRQAVKMGLFVVDEVELSGPPNMMMIRAKAAPQQSTPAKKTPLQTQKWRSWDAGTTLGGMVATIAEEHGMESAVPAALASQELPHYDQVGESDINLLTRAAKTYDAIVKPANGKLVVTKKAASETVSGQSLPTVTVAATELTDWSVTISERDHFNTVTATWYDQDAAEEKAVTVGEGEPVKALRHGYKNEAEAKAAAQSELDGRSRGQSTLSFTLPGRTDLIAESRLKLTGLRPGINQEWLVTRVTHTIDGSGYRVSGAAETPK